MQTAKCIECDADVPLADDVVTGEIIECRECGVELEVMSVDPPRLNQAPQEEEDWGE
jgi:alpha-aminoadipate carrier protein LysW